MHNPLKSSHLAIVGRFMARRPIQQQMQRQVNIKEYGPARKYSLGFLYLTEFATA